MPEITALFWDNGGVILTNGWDVHSRQKAIAKFQLDPADFESRHELMLDAFECGRITLDEYVQRTIFYKPRSFTPEDFKKFMFDQSQPFPESLAFLAKLVKARGDRTFASLNNESREINEYRIKSFHLRDYFEVFFCSCYLGIRKPDPGIYKLALSITQRAPGECVMIDDRGLNLESARELGMHTIKFQSVAQLRDDLARLGVTAAEDAKGFANS